MEPNTVLDLEALRQSTNHSSKNERRLLMLFVETAERCLVKMQWLVFNGDNHQWQSNAQELKAASTDIHAEALSARCKYAVDVVDDVILRMSAYLYAKEAFEGVLAYLRKENLLNLPVASKIIENP